MLHLSICRRVIWWTFLTSACVSICYAQNETAFRINHNKTDYPIMNASWCQDLSECCPFEYLNNKKFTDMLIDFCYDQFYGFMGVKDCGIDEDKEKAEFKGPEEYTNMQIDLIMDEVTKALAEEDDKKKAFLTDPLFYCPFKVVDRCYWKVYKMFQIMCLNPLYNRYSRLFKHVFVHACEASWLDLPKIGKILKTTCSEKETIMMGF